MVIDGAGGGKTTLIARANHKVLSAAAGKHYLDASVPSPATFKSMVGTLLQRSGYPVSMGQREGWSLWETLRGRLYDHGVTVLFLRFGEC